MPAKKVEITGKVVRCDVKSNKPQYGYRSYDRGREHYDITLQLTVETEDGKRYWCYTPPAHYSVNTSGPFSVAIVRPNDWIAKSRQRWDCEGFAGARGMGHLYESRLKVGDTVKIEGRVKNANSKYGIQLSHVRRLDFSYDDLQRAWHDRCAAAHAFIPTDLPPEATPPVIPGVEWHRTGGYLQPDEQERGILSGEDRGHRYFGWAHQVKSIETLLAYVEGKSVEECYEPG